MQYPTNQEKSIPTGDDFGQLFKERQVGERLVVGRRFTLGAHDDEVFGEGEALGDQVHLLLQKVISDLIGKSSEFLQLFQHVAEAQDVFVRGRGRGGAVHRRRSAASAAATAAFQAIGDLLKTGEDGAVFVHGHLCYDVVLAQIFFPSKS